MLARAVGDQMTKSLGQPVVVENRAGAGGNTGALAVATAAPDGYTLLMSSAGILTANPHLYAKMPFDVETAFIPISNVAEMSMLLVVHPKVEATTLKEFVALAKARPGKLNFGSPGIGTTGHLGLAMFMHAAGVQITHVPYRGAAPAVQDLIAGQIDGVVDNPPTVISHIQAGKLRPLAVAAKTRMALLPDVPTAAEGGVAELRGLVLVRHCGARRHAAGHRRAPAQGDRSGDPQSGDGRALRQIRRASGRQHAGRVRGADPRRARAMGRDHQGRRYQGGVGQSQ